MIVWQAVLGSNQRRTDKKPPKIYLYPFVALCRGRLDAPGVLFAMGRSSTIGYCETDRSLKNEEGGGYTRARLGQSPKCAEDHPIGLRLSQSTMSTEKSKPGIAMHRIGFYAGLFIVAAVGLMLQLIQTRILSVVGWYHLAFFVIS
ncbi:MAG: hypothetical protein GEV05_03445, partial [Betaproteobacteria bacterium]|nr:hypothetical protein [Betaproteobacteria bacterium]